ncbi:MAG TPA: hypothetical protein VD997_11665 [Phycisphaerales bacterium]|nr:hypothetical protein [Phycisphaerales bacterium]
MKSVLLGVLGAVIGAALVMGGSPVVAQAAGEPVVEAGVRLGSRTVSIAGKRVMVEVSARRNFGFLANPQGRLQTSVFLATADNTPLPGITSVKVSLRRGTARWSPVLAKVMTSIDSNAYYVANNGPLWPANSIVTATVEIRTNGSVARFDVPVKISVNRQLVPQPGV